MKIVAAVVGLSILFSLGAARAQVETEQEARARTLFEEANVAADAENFVEARRLFERSLEVLPRPATALNLAQVLRSVGALRDSELMLISLANAEYGPVSEKIRVTAEALLARVRSELAHVEVTIANADEASLRIDAEEPKTLRAGVGQIFSVDPGTHLVVARSKDGRSLERSFTLTAAEHFRLSLVFDPPLVAGTTPPEAEAFPWLGVTIGAVVVVGIVVGIVAIAAANPSEESLTDPVWGQATALRARD